MNRLVVISNRLPIIISKSEGRFKIREGAGGLVTALKPMLKQRGGAWVGFSGMYEADRGGGWEETLEQYDGKAIDYRAVTPQKKIYDGYYNHYANEELWPRFHSMTSKMSGDAASYWSDYVSINHLFADQTGRIVGSDELIWIHDYHLMLLPQILRERQYGQAIGHFLHIPFPSAEIMAGQPHARELLHGVLGADLLGFHIPAYMSNFVDAARDILQAEVVRHDETRATLQYDGRTIQLGAYPIGIEPAQMQQQDTQAVRQRLPDAAETLILSMDRLDYTKAIPPRLEAYGQLLDQAPQYQQKLSLVQLVDVSRKDIPAYQEEREKVESIVADIRKRFPTWPALYFAAERWKRKEVAGLMRLAKLCVVTPRCDGMNLVAKEYVAAAPDDGVLVLSRQAGAAWQFGEHAVMVDGESTESIVAGLRQALEMPDEERRSRMAKLKENVRDQDVFWWAGRFLEDLQVETAGGA